MKNYFSKIRELWLAFFIWTIYISNMKSKLIWEVFGKCRTKMFNIFSPFWTFFIGFSLIKRQKIHGFSRFFENSQTLGDSFSKKIFSISKMLGIFISYVPRSVDCAMFRGLVGFLKIHLRSMMLEEFRKFHFHHPTVVPHLNVHSLKCPSGDFFTLRFFT